MRNSIGILAAVFYAAGLLIPSWYLSILGLVPLAFLFPAWGILAGFICDILFGALWLLPLPISYPFTIGATAIGIVSLVFRNYLR